MDAYGGAKRRVVGSPSFLSRAKTGLSVAPQLFLVRDTRGLAAPTRGEAGARHRRGTGRIIKSTLQFLLVPQRPTPELVDGLGDPRRVAEDSHVRGVLEHNSLDLETLATGSKGVLVSAVKDTTNRSRDSDSPAVTTEETRRFAKMLLSLFTSVLQAAR